MFCSSSTKMKNIIYFLLFTTCYALYKNDPNVTTLTPETFRVTVLESDKVWLIEYYVAWCGHCQQQVPEVSKCAKILKGAVEVGAIDIDGKTEFADSEGILDTPTVKIFGFDKKKPIFYDGPKTGEKMADACMKILNENVKTRYSQESQTEVIKLTDNNFMETVIDSPDMWMVEFYAPWCGHCKNLQPEWEKAAKILKGNIKFGALDATMNKDRAQLYNIRSYPTIKMFPPGKKTKFFNYEGGRTADSIANWALQQSINYLPLPDIKEITSNEFNERGKHIWVISILPHILDCDSKCRNAYLGLLKKLGEKFKSNQWGWVWAEAGAQKPLESSLDIGGFGYPAMAVINLNKMKYSLMKGSFSDDGINEFLRDISYGRGDSSSLKGAKMPEIIDTMLWDGKDGVLPEIDELDDDLDDIKLNSEDDESEKNEPEENIECLASDSINKEPENMKEFGPKRPEKKILLEKESETIKEPINFTITTGTMNLSVNLNENSDSQNLENSEPATLIKSAEIKADAEPINEATECLNTGQNIDTGQSKTCEEPKIDTGQIKVAPKEPENVIEDESAESKDEL